MGENVFSASLLMKKLGGANDTVLPQGGISHVPVHAGGSCLKSSCPEGDLGIPEDMKTTQQCAPGNKSTLGSNRQSSANRSRQVNLPLFAALVRPHLMYCVQFHSTGEIQNYWRMQQGSTAPQQLSFKKRPGLLNLAKRRLREDLINVYKYLG